MSFKQSALSISFLLSSLVSSVIGDTCSTVGSASSVSIKDSPDLEYLSEQTNYWSTNCGNLKPSCILYPESAQEVAAIVKVLNQNNESFVIKSGGHNPNEGFASIKGAPLISTKYLNEVIFDEASMTVRVGPGNDWEDVHEVLDTVGVTVVGGRIGEVGVGGYVLGGGLSFLSTNYGWAANNIVEYEVVLANATIVKASKSLNTDLFKALKGAGNSFGIVTSYTMVAHPQGQIWGGNLVFTADKTPQMLAAVRNFTENYPDEKAAIIMTAEYGLLGVLDLWIMFLFYDGPTPPAGVFDFFTDIGPTINNCKTRSYNDLLTANNFGVLKGQIYTIATETTPLPNVTVGAEVLGAYYDHWKDTTKSILAVPGALGSIAFQPIPKMMARKARELGGDLIDLDDDVDRIIIEYNYSYLSSLNDDKMDAATQTLYNGQRDLVTKYQKSGHLPDAYLPLFMNDGYHRQDYFGRLRPENAKFASTVRDRYDPKGFFAKRTGGFKL